MANTHCGLRRHVAPWQASVPIILAFLVVGLGPQECSAQGGKDQIAFVSNRSGNDEIWLAEADGARPPVNLTNNPARDYDPCWSPDGSKIVFVSERDGRPQIYVMDARGQDQTNLSHSAAFDFLPQWSPNGQRTAFLRKEGARVSLCVMEATGEHQASVPCEIVPHLTHQCWSADSNWIAYMRPLANQRDTDVCSICLTDPKPMRLTGSDGEQSDRFPAWSPDGNYIVFDFVTERRSAICAVTADGKLKTPLAAKTAANSGGGWSHDGKRVAFRSQRGDFVELCLVDVANGADTQLTHLQDHNGMMQYDWSPDDTRIVFSFDRGQGGSQVKIVDVKTLQIHDLTNAEHYNLAPRWRPRSTGKQSQIPPPPQPPAPPAPQPQPEPGKTTPAVRRYTLTDLGASWPSGPATAVDINNVGQVLLGTGDGRGPGPTIAVIWKAGQVVPIPKRVDDVLLGRAVALNDSGVCLMEGFTSSAKYVTIGGIPHLLVYTFLYHDGGLTWLSALRGGNTTGASALNEAGEVVGFTGFNPDPRQPWPSVQAGFIWRQGQTKPLKTLGGKTAFPTDINDAGDIVGWSAGADGKSHACLWKGGEPQELGPVSGGMGRPLAVNSRGLIAGFATGEGARTRACQWLNGVATELPMPGGETSQALDVDEQGEIVGCVYTNRGRSLAVVWVNGEMVDLNSRMEPAAPGWVLERAVRVNDLGQIIGMARLNGQDRPFLLTPTDMGAAAVTPQTAPTPAAKSGPTTEGPTAPPAVGPEPALPAGNELAQPPMQPRVRQRASGGPAKIAVLPFLSPEGEAERETAETVAEAIGALAPVLTPQEVVGRQPNFPLDRALRGDAEHLYALGRALGVQYLVRGTVEGDRRSAVTVVLYYLKSKKALRTLTRDMAGLDPGAPEWDALAEELLAGDPLSFLGRSAYPGRVR